MNLQAWSFPGEPACSFVKELAAAKGKISTIRMQYFLVEDSGLIVMKPLDYGCNGFTKANAATLKKLTKYQFVTIGGSSVVGLRKLWGTPAQRTQSTNRLVNFVIDIDYTGIDVDFEGMRNWSKVDWQNYLTWLNTLGKALHTKGKQLNVTLPSNAQGIYPFKFDYGEFDGLEIDWITTMNYDEMWNNGAGNPRASTEWIKSGIDQVKARISDHSKIVVGLATDVYYGKTGTYDIKYNSTHNVDLSKARRDPESNELHMEKNGVFYSGIDEEGLNAKIKHVQDQGINNICLWYLGGNNPLP